MPRVEGFRHAASPFFALTTETTDHFSVAHMVRQASLVVVQVDVSSYPSLAARGP